MLTIKTHWLASSDFELRAHSNRRYFSHWKIVIENGGKFFYEKFYVPDRITLRLRLRRVERTALRCVLISRATN